MDSTFDLAQFNAFDLLLVVTILFSIVISSVRGFVREAIGLGAWSGAVYAGLYLHTWVTPLIGRFIADPHITQLASMIATFFMGLLFLLSIVQWISYAVHNSLARSVDRSLGILFGAFRGIFLIMAAYLGALCYIPLSEQPAIVQLSKSRLLLNKGTFLCAPYMPSYFHKNPIFQETLRAIQPPKSMSAQELTNELSKPKPPQGIHFIKEF